MKNLLVVATMDTKGREAGFIRDVASNLEIRSMLMDIGIKGSPQVTPDITNRELAEAVGTTIDNLLRGNDRFTSVKAIQEGGLILAKGLLEKGMLDGIIGLGGGTGTAMITYIMRHLPYGLPKVMVSTVASRDVREYVGTKDIVMFHSVADILGDNAFIRHILAQATYAVWGMMVKGTAIVGERPMIGVTAYGINSACALHAETFLRKKGYEMIAFHANGCGGMAMEGLIAEGKIQGVLEFTPHELADDIYGGYCKGIGPERFETAGRMGIPMVFAPGGLDNAVFSPVYPMPEALKGRKIYRHDERFCVRMMDKEMERFGEFIGEKLNKAKGKVHVLIPLKGWSEADKEGMPLFDPSVDLVFVKKLREVLRGDIPIEEIDLHISEPAFAERAVEILYRLIEA
ncbi:MAG: Tm-1-like ATP-binding domain-containing protein [Syntrophorhabdaceae bacterium]|nr:Tm-1-like ATP-binding domain-containing protein [Syntrophorhabdaceae bacterium]